MALTDSLGAGTLLITTAQATTSWTYALFFICALVLALGVWVLVIGRVSDRQCAVLLAAFTAAFTVQTLGYESAALRWAAMYGMSGIPMISLMLTKSRCTAVVSGVCVVGQAIIVMSLSLTAVEAAVALAILCVVMPLVVGNTWILLQRSERLRLQAEHAASVDYLTGLLNRRALRERWPALARAALRDGHQPGLLLIDVDHFKAINDSYGHDAGDAVLAALGDHLSRSSRGQALVVRLGGEEFAVVDSFADGLAARRAAERLRRGVEAVEVPGLPPLRISIGVAVSTAAAGVDGRSDQGGQLDALLTCADEALYKAKSGGRNRVEVAPPLALQTV